jgi:hypothetical protein
MAQGTLISLGGNLEHPRDSKPSDYPSVGPSGAAGMSSGAGQLVKQTDAQEGPSRTQDSGEQTPSVWGKADFPVQVNKGEGGSPSTAVKCDWSVSLETGAISPDLVKYPA